MRAKSLSVYSSLVHVLSIQSPIDLRSFGLASLNMRFFGVPSFGRFLGLPFWHDVVVFLSSDPSPAKNFSKVGTG